MITANWPGKRVNIEEILQFIPFEKIDLELGQELGRLICRNQELGYLNFGVI
jgi:hypothetical protein